MRSMPNRAARGFSLVELMVVVAVLAVLLAMAIPGFRSWRINANIRSVAEGINDGLQFARGEAVRRNTPVEFVLNNADGGWTVRLIDTTVLQQKPAGEVDANVTVTRTPNTTWTVTYAPFGIVTSPNNDATLPLTQVDLDVPVSVLPADQSREMRVLIGTGGDVRICDPNKVMANDARGC